MKDIRTVSFEARDTLADVVNMLVLAEKNISDIEHQGDEVLVQGASAVIWCAVKALQEIEADIAKSLKGGN